MKRILLDTSAYSRFLSGDQKVMEVLSEAETIFMSIFVLGELHSGFRGGKKYQQNKAYLQAFLQKSTVAELDATHETAEIFGQIKNALKKAGHPLPINDVWISAHALETGSVVVTYDSHFSHVPGLRLWDDL